MENNSYNGKALELLEIIKEDFNKYESEEESKMMTRNNRDFNRCVMNQDCLYRDIKLQLAELLREVDRLALNINVDDRLNKATVLADKVLF